VSDERDPKQDEELQRSDEDVEAHRKQNFSGPVDPESPSIDVHDDGDEVEAHIRSHH
jgi:hypothetical protein